MAVQVEEEDHSEVNEISDHFNKPRFTNQCNSTIKVDEVLAAVVVEVAELEFLEIVKFSAKRLKSLVDHTKEPLESLKTPQRAQRVLSCIRRVKRFPLIAITLRLWEHRLKTGAFHHSDLPIALLVTALRHRSTMLEAKHQHKDRRLRNTILVVEL